MRPSTSSLLQTATITFASMLGIGILGLPTSLYLTGLAPFLATFTLNFFAHVIVTIFGVEVLVRALFLSADRAAPQKLTENTCMSPSSPSADPHATPPSLYSIGKLFIPGRGLRVFFNFLVYSHFVLVLVTYILAIPQAYTSLIPAMSAIPFPVFCAVYMLISSVFVYSFTPLIVSSMSIATIFKGLLLTLLVVLTFLRGLAIHRPSLTSWSLTALIDPFLISTFSINGTIHLMPVTFQVCLDSVPRRAGRLHERVDREFVTAFRNAILAGLTVCFLLNILWCAAVLNVVPQNATALSLGGANAAFNFPHNITLAAAHANGEISTVPLIGVLNASHDRVNRVVAILVDSFIAVSLTVSIILMGLAMKHYIDGAVKDDYAHLDSAEGGAVVDDEQPALLGGEGSAASEQGQGVLKLGKQGSTFARYWVSIGLVLLIALFNQKSMYKIMEGVMTVSVNMEAALSVIYMFYMSSVVTSMGDGTPIPNALSPLTAKLLMVVSTVFYMTAVLVDVVFYVPKQFAQA